MYNGCCSEHTSTTGSRPVARPLQGARPWLSRTNSNPSPKPPPPRQLAQPRPPAPPKPEHITRSAAANKVIAELDGPTTPRALAKAADAMFVQGGGKTRIKAATWCVRRTLETAESLGAVTLTRPTDLMVEHTQLGVQWRAALCGRMACMVPPAFFCERSVCMNSIMVIEPYRYVGTWVFDDAAMGLDKEPFVAGVPEMIDYLVRDIPKADKGFRMTFSAKPFPGHQYRLTWLRTENEGNWYKLDDPPMEGWFCRACSGISTVPRLSFM